MLRKLGVILLFFSNHNLQVACAHESDGTLTQSNDFIAAAASPKATEIDYPDNNLFPGKDTQPSTPALMLIPRLSLTDKKEGSLSHAPSSPPSLSRDDFSEMSLKLDQDDRSELPDLPDDSIILGFPQRRNILSSHLISVPGLTNVRSDFVRIVKYHKFVINLMKQGHLAKALQRADFKQIDWLFELCLILRYPKSELENGYSNSFQISESQFKTCNEMIGALVGMPLSKANDRRFLFKISILSLVLRLTYPSHLDHVNRFAKFMMNIVDISLRPKATANVTLRNDIPSVIEGYANMPISEELTPFLISFVLRGEGSVRMFKLFAEIILSVYQAPIVIPLKPFSFDFSSHKSFVFANYYCYDVLAKLERNFGIAAAMEFASAAQEFPMTLLIDNGIEYDISEIFCKAISQYRETPIADLEQAYEQGLFTRQSILEFLPRHGPYTDENAFYSSFKGPLIAAVILSRTDRTCLLVACSKYQAILSCMELASKAYQFFHRDQGEMAVVDVKGEMIWN